MLPVLLNLKFIKIYTFGVFLVLAFFWGGFILWRNIRLTSQKEEEIFDGLFLSLAGGLFVSRAVFVILNFDKFGFDLLKFILINGYPGLSLYGAIFGGFLSLYFYCGFNKIKFRQIADYFITPLFVSLVFGKLGSFFSGSEVAAKTNFFLSVKYIGYDGLRHLTALYESMFFLLGAYLSYRFIFEVRKEKLPNGFVFYFFGWYFALIYSIFDRLKVSRLYLIPYTEDKLKLSFNFIVSGILLLTLSLYFFYYFRDYLLTYGKPTYKKITKKISGVFGKRGKKTQ